MTYAQRNKFMHCYTSPHPHPQIHVHKADTHSPRHRDANIRNRPTWVLLCQPAIHTDTHTRAHTHLKEDIFLALVFTTCACKLDFQSVLILCWHLWRQNRGGQTQPFGWAYASLLRCNVRNCWCRINAHFYEFILCHRAEKNLGVNIHHTA